MANAEDMGLEEVNTKIESLEGIIGTLQGRLGRLKQRRADLTCPFKVGDVLIDYQGQRARITEIRTTSRYGETYALAGVYLNKNGSVARNPGRDNDKPRYCVFYSFNEWKKEGGN